MNILVNCSNLKAGGGLQVADSICRQLHLFPNHRFVVVLSKYLDSTAEHITLNGNLIVVRYDISNNIQTVLFGRDTLLDRLVEEQHVSAVLTVFGPSRWRPRVPHLSGFALPQIVIPESPFFQRMGICERMKWKVWCKVRKWSLQKSTDAFWTENPYISERLKKIMGGGNYDIEDRYLLRLEQTATNMERRLAA